MRNASDPPGRHGYHCDACGRFVVTAVDGLFSNPATGSPARFCSPACRQAAWRRRQAGVDETTPLQHHGGRTRKLGRQPPAGPAGHDPTPTIAAPKEVAHPSRLEVIGCADVGIDSATPARRTPATRRLRAQPVVAPASAHEADAPSSPRAEQAGREGRFGVDAGLKAAKAEGKKNS